MKRVMITGASGPLGIVLIQECIKHGVEVIAIVRPDSPRREEVPKHSLVKLVEWDIQRIAELSKKLSEKIDVCFHLAWTHTGDEGRNNPILQAENINNTLHAAECAKALGCSAFIGAGSQAEYGILNRKIDEKTLEQPVTLYGITKLAAGRLVQEYCRQQKMRCNWVRIFSVYGPYENSYIFTAYIIQTLLRGEKPVLTACEQNWDFLYCKDAVRALYLIAEKAEESGVYCLGSGRSCKMKDMVSLIQKEINTQMTIEYGKKPYGEKQIMNLEADIRKLTKDTGFVPEYTLEQGIRETIAWYREQQI